MCQRPAAAEEQHRIASLHAWTAYKAGRRTEGISRLQALAAVDWSNPDHTQNAVGAYNVAFTVCARHIMLFRLALTNCPLPLSQYALLTLAHLEGGSCDEAERVLSTAAIRGLATYLNITVAQWLVTRARDNSAVCPAHLQSVVMRRMMDVLLAHRLVASLPE